jgi:hypothetical protein
MFFLLTVLLLIGAGMLGCSSKSDEESKGHLGTTAPINNNAPEAKNASAAPVDPTIIYPWQKGKKGGAPKSP